MRIRARYPKDVGGASRLGALTLASGCLVSCMVEAPKDDGPNAKRLPHPTSDQRSTDFSACRLSIGHGCLEGHVDARQRFFVDGKDFFDANDLAARFHELLHVQSGGKDVSAGDNGGYQLVLTTPLDNDSFISGFEYDVSGPVLRSGETRSDGGFGVEDLEPGDYRLRVSKTVKFALLGTTAPAANPPAAGTHLDTPADPAATAKAYCATLYQDQNFPVREGQQVAETLSDFRLHVTDGACDSGSNQTTINL